MIVRITKPGEGNNFYRTKRWGGFSECIVGNPRDYHCDVLANCVGYACGRFNEIIGEMRYPKLNCNAEDFIERAKNLGLEISDTPTLGGIIVWEGIGNLAGHVAIVERIDNSNQIFTSESNYGGIAFCNCLRTNNNGRWGLSNNYRYLGCIVNPAIGRVTFIPPTPAQPTVDNSNNDLKERILLETKKVIRGDYGNGHDNRERAIGLGHEVYEKIRSQVTANCNAGLTRWDNIRLFEELL